jgi:RND family efflux transporter MFP subunit
MVESTRIRLGYWGVSLQQVAELEASGQVFRTLKVAAPAGGVVMKRLDGLEGMAVQPGTELFHIADLSSLWLSVELFEEQLAWVHEGTAAEIALSYFPGESFRGKVRFLEPELSEMTRTVRAMIEVDNRDGRLRKGMYATVTLQPVVLKDVLAVPTQAVLRTGQRDVVVEALGDGRFVPREVRLGEEAGGFTAILSGLAEGATVVTSAQFLLDSESRLREAVQRMVVERGAGEPSAPAPSSAPAPPAKSAADDHEGHR